MISFTLKGSSETEVFVSQAGYIAIKQGDDVVSLSSAQARRVADMILQLADISAEWEELENTEES